MQQALVFNLQKFSIHDGAGIRTDVFFQGCNLRCGWCSNPESQPMEPLPGEKATAYTVDALVAELVKDKPFYDESGGGVTLTGGEVLLQHARGHESEGVVERARADGGDDLVGLGGREDEAHVVGWLLDELEQRVEARIGDHVGLVDDVDLVAR